MTVRFKALKEIAERRKRLNAKCKKLIAKRFSRRFDDLYGFFNHLMKNHTVVNPKAAKDAVDTYLRHIFFGDPTQPAPSWGNGMPITILASHNETPPEPWEYADVQALSKLAMEASGRDCPPTQYSDASSESEKDPSSPEACISQPDELEHDDPNSDSDNAPLRPNMPLVNPPAYTGVSAPSLRQKAHRIPKGEGKPFVYTEFAEDQVPDQWKGKGLNLSPVRFKWNGVDPVSFLEDLPQPLPELTNPHEEEESEPRDDPNDKGDSDYEEGSGMARPKGHHVSRKSAKDSDVPDVDEVAEQRMPTVPEGDKARVTPAHNDPGESASTSRPFFAPTRIFREGGYSSPEEVDYEEDDSA
ncbi:hypothetical protein AeMF1_008576 [Aphanomyces euteiches]|nr:hypothetical protein AeMF1_008576 [Aphanomyces euteiches]